MKNLFTFCACALLACTMSAQTMTLAKGDMTGGFTYNSEYENEAIMDDLAITVGYAFSDNMAIFATRDENNAGSDGDATWDLGLRYFHKGFYGQLNLNDALGDDEEGVEDEAMSLNIGAMMPLNIGSMDGLYVDPYISLKADDDNEATDEMNFGFTLGYKF